MKVQVSAARIVKINGTKTSELLFRGNVFLTRT